MESEIVAESKHEEIRETLSTLSRDEASDLGIGKLPYMPFPVPPAIFILPRTNHFTPLAHRSHQGKSALAQAHRASD